MTKLYHLDAEQGKIENRSKSYFDTMTRVSQILTQLCAKSKSRVFSSAKKQAFAMGGFDDSTS